MKIKYSIVLMLSLFLISCATYNAHYIIQPQDLKGIYVQKDNKSMELYLNDSTFVFKDNYKQLICVVIEKYSCCDTISYGNWRIESNNFLSLSSSNELYGSPDLKVEEKEGFSKDSVYFIIDNPIERYNKKNNISRYLSYQILTGNFDDEMLEPFPTNYIAIPKSKDYLGEDFGVGTIELFINIDGNAPIRNVESRLIISSRYEVQNPKANVFKISIPKLDHNFVSCKRLRHDYVKIINKHKLLWDGQVYIKKH